MSCATTMTEYRERAISNGVILERAMAIQKELNKDPEVSEKVKGGLKLKMAVKNQDVFTSNAEITVIGLDSDNLVLYAHVSTGRHDEGDVTSILLGDIGPIQFVSPFVQNKIIESFAK